MASVLQEKHTRQLLWDTLWHLPKYKKGHCSGHRTHGLIPHHAPTHHTAEQARALPPTRGRAGVPTALVAAATPEAASSAAQKRSMNLNGATRARRPERLPEDAEDMSSTMSCR